MDAVSYRSVLLIVFKLQRLHLLNHLDTHVFFQSHDDGFLGAETAEIDEDVGVPPLRAFQQ